MLAEPPDTAAAAGIGAALVEHGLVDPDAIAVTIAVLGDRLLADLGLDESTFARPAARPARRARRRLRPAPWPR